jgi:hypothetical protein
VAKNYLLLSFSGDRKVGTVKTKNGIRESFGKSCSPAKYPLALPKPLCFGRLLQHLLRFTGTLAFRPGGAATGRSGRPGAWLPELALKALHKKG